MKDFKKLDIVVLPTDNKSVVSIDTNLNKLVYARDYHLDYFYNQGTHITHHLYLLSDSDIRNGDWTLDKYNQVWKVSNGKLIAFDKSGVKRFSTDNIEGHECRKIERTTNTSLKTYKTLEEDCHIYSNSLLEFTDEFLRDFCKKSKIDSSGNITTTYSKESWTREEVEELCRTALHTIFPGNMCMQEDADKWIANNIK